jgi:hypothetical protein
MSRSAMQILEQFRSLPLPEEREVAHAILIETKVGQGARARRNLNEVLGRFEPLPAASTKDHNSWVAEAILASKGAGGAGV